MSTLFQLPELLIAQSKSPSKSDREAEPKSMPRKNAPDRDTKKAKSSEAESSNKNPLPLASEAIQRAIESQDNDAFTKAVKSYCASLEEEEHKSKDAQKNLRAELQEMIEKPEEHHRLIVLNRLTLVYRPNETVTEALSSQYEDDSIAYIEDIVNHFLRVC